MEISSHLENFKRDGYTVFENVYDTAQMAAWKLKFDELQSESASDMNRPSWWFGHMLERAPKLMLPTISNPDILDFAERVLGPFVQLDNLTLAAFPSTTENVEGRISGWHRDRWGQVPRSDAYERPHAINAISYLQDLTPAFGPLRVIPGSHRKPITMEVEARGVPYVEERVLDVRAGDAIVIHNNLIHSGTPNTSGQTRYFFSVYYNLTWIKPTDNHFGPNVMQMKREARAQNDHRMLRLLGEDDYLEARANSGFLSDDETNWQAWCDADKAAKKL